MTLLAGQLLDHKYVLLHTLGQGGFGEVWLAQDQVLGNHHVAIKFLTTSSPAKDQNFLVEMRALAGLNLPGIVTFHHHFRHQKQLALVMEHCAGGSLLKRLGDRRPEDTQTWVNQVSQWMIQRKRSGISSIKTFQNLPPSRLRNQRGIRDANGSSSDAALHGGGG